MEIKSVLWLFKEVQNLSAGAIGPNGYLVTPFDIVILTTPKNASQHQKMQKSGILYCN
jgi:hypothetical protein